MKKIILLLPLLLNFILNAQSLAPEVISATGGHSASSSVSVSWTVGEVVSDTYVSTNTLTKGFHQPHSVALNSVKETAQGGFVYAYPNPVLNDLILDFHNMQSGTYQIEIFDVSGKQLEQRPVYVDTDSYKEKMDMNNFDEGLYLFKITNASKSISKVFKVTKQK